MIINIRGHEILVDEKDAHFAKEKWFLQPTKAKSFKYYARAAIKIDGKWKKFYLHRLIMNAAPGVQIDHINGCTLDNRRENLRFATAGQNCFNSKKRQGSTHSQFKGVTREHGKWRARITHGGKKSSLGMFTSEESAALAYDCAALEKFGEFAHTNFRPTGKMYVL